MGCRGADGLGWFQKIQQLRLIVTADMWTGVNWTQAFLLWRYLAVATTKQDTHTMTTLPKDPEDPRQEKKFKPHGTTLAQTLLSHAWVLFIIYCGWRPVVLTQLQELLVQNIIPNSILRNTKQREKVVSIPCPVEGPSSPIKINSPHDIGGCNDHHPCYVSYVKTTSEPRVGKVTGGPRWATLLV